MTKKGLKALQKKVTPKMEKKYFPLFEKQSRFLGNGVYGIGRLHSTDPRELFLMFVGDMENLDYEDKNFEFEDEVA